MAKSTQEITKVALFAALTTVVMYIFRIPAFDGRVYFHLGDAVIITGAIMLDRRSGALAGGLGSALADIVLGSAIWAPISFVIHGVQAWVISSFADGRGGKRDFMAMLAGGLVMVVGYTSMAAALYGAAVVPIELVGDIMQSALGIGVAIVFLKTLRRFPRLTGKI